MHTAAVLQTIKGGQDDTPGQTTHFGAASTTFNPVCRLMIKPGSAVVVVGSLHYDVMVHAPTRPRQGETVTGQKWYPKFGGKGGNQAVAAARANLNGSARFVGAVGVDTFGSYMRDGLIAAGINCNWLTQSPNTGTGMSVAIIDASGDYGAVIVTGANADITPDHLADPALWRGAGVLILQNEVPDHINIAAAQQAKSHGLVTCLNAAPTRTMPTELASLIDILVVNAIEAHDICGQSVASLKDAERAALALSQTFETVIVTAGGDGLALARRGADVVSIAALPVELVDTHGAGDVFVGTLCAAIANGQTIEAACHSANAASARHVSGGH